ncbi:hypothetical protein DTO013E5_2754 [Penicillium roqueforti]|uniref:Genomic scaffold, ProqFM164S01 n=1 Tax=Penicillium roqueforti (strain FM164) TaxID=1365484 RepID=W6QD36_PENRF|nr:hypothetical protein CBS147372_6190 [Penicillium roqueforti]CDM27517.1 unnamed protein product [Penicillium roqueforti FM164]KAI2738136.1 hypothetical protein DTO012A1_7050 [Penicillium roqueforti]KAI2749337.1 hypothetical protein DTO013F2_5633 [Penicillium roqueforti]KAI2765601.1 hypothetical protein DTO012A8_9178 [Penicillium roqueforti]
MRIQGRTTNSPAGGSGRVYFDEEDDSPGREHAPSQRESNTIPEATPQLNLTKEPYRSFNVFKDVPLGTNAFSFCLQVHPSGGLAQSPSPVYHTLRIPWYRQGLYLPASFDLYSGGNVVRSRKDPSPDPKDHRAHIHYRGFEGLLGLHVTVDIFRQVGSNTLQNDLPASEERLDLVKHCSVDIVRKGIGRTYRVEITGGGAVRTFYWKGSKTALSLLQTEEKDAGPSDGNGNLKFFAANKPDDILAVWQNRTDRQILGSLNVIAELDADSDGILEGSMVSCLAVVVAERVSGRGWIGGLGKSRNS